MWVYADLIVSGIRLSADIISLSRVIGSQVGIQPKKKAREIMALHNCHGLGKRKFYLFT